MKKNIKYTLIALLAVFGLASCDKNDYEYSAPELVAGSQVYFPMTNATSIELNTLDGEFTIPVTRIDTTQAINAQLISKCSSDKYTVAEGIAFEANQKDAEIKVSYAGLEYDEFDTLTITLDADVATPYGGSECVLIVGAPAPWTPWCSTKAEWAAAGMDADAWPFADCTGICTYTYTQIFGGDDTGLPFYYRQSTIDPTQGEIRVDNWCYGVSLVLSFNPQTNNIQILPQFTGYTDGDVGDFYITDVSHWQGKDYYASYPCVYDSETGQIYLSTAWMAGDNHASCYGYGAEFIQLDGFYIPDYSVVAEFDGVLTKGDNVYAQVMVDYGVDAEAVKAYIAQKSDDAAAVADALASGDVEGFDVVKGVNKFPLGDLSGELKVVIATIAGGEAQAVTSAGFEYYPAGDASPWKSLGMGLFTDGILTPLFYTDDQGNQTVPTPTYAVEIKESTETPGLYRVMNPYSNSVYPYAENDCAEDGLYLEVHAEDPNFVYVSQQSLGFDWGMGEMSFVTEAGRYVDAGYSKDVLLANDIYGGTLKDGVIDFHVFTSKSGANYQGYLVIGESAYYTGNAELKIVLPSAVPAGVKAMKMATKKHYSRSFHGTKYQLSKKVNKGLVRVGKPVSL